MLRRAIRRLRRLLHADLLDELAYLRIHVAALREEQAHLRLILEERRAPEGGLPPVMLAQLEQTLLTIAFAGPTSR